MSTTNASTFTRTMSSSSNISAATSYEALDWCSDGGCCNLTNSFTQQQQKATMTEPKDDYAMSCPEETFSIQKIENNDTSKFEQNIPYNHDVVDQNTCGPKKLSLSKKLFRRRKLNNKNINMNSSAATSSKLATATNGRTAVESSASSTSTAASTQLDETSIATTPLMGDHSLSSSSPISEQQQQQSDLSLNDIPPLPLLCDGHAKTTTSRTIPTIPDTTQMQNPPLQKRHLTATKSHSKDDDERYLGPIDLDTLSEEDCSATSRSSSDFESDDMNKRKQQGLDDIAATQSDPFSDIVFTDSESLVQVSKKQSERTSIVDDTQTGGDDNILFHPVVAADNDHYIVDCVPDCGYHQIFATMMIEQDNNETSPLIQDQSSPNVQPATSVTLTGQDDSFSQNDSHLEDENDTSVLPKTESMLSTANADDETDIFDKIQDCDDPPIISNTTSIEKCSDDNDPLLLLLQRSSMDLPPKRSINPYHLDEMLLRVIHDQEADETTTVASSSTSILKKVLSPSTKNIPSGATLTNSAHVSTVPVDDVIAEHGLMEALLAGPVDVDDFIPEDSYWAMDTHDFVLDEVEYSRQLIGYQEGCEPPTINDISLMNDDDDDDDEQDAPLVIRKVRNNIHHDILLQRSKMTRQRTSATADSAELIRRSVAIQQSQQRNVRGKPVSVIQKPPIMISSSNNVNHLHHHTNVVPPSPQNQERRIMNGSRSPTRPMRQQPSPQRLRPNRVHLNNYAMTGSSVISSPSTPHHQQRKNNTLPAIAPQQQKYYPVSMASPSKQRQKQYIAAIPSHTAATSAGLANRQPDIQFSSRQRHNQYTLPYQPLTGGTDSHVATISEIRTKQNNFMSSTSTQAEV